MAKILPDSLNTILEGEYFNKSFNYELDSNESFSSIKIIESNFPDYISIDGNSFYGVFRNLFDLPKDSLKYRKGLEYGTASNFNELPPKGTADLYSFTAPSEMIKNYTIKVKLSYFDISDPAIELNITKEYIQQVQGNWDSFKNNFLEYLR